ncbi:AAA family ATPase [Alloyangia pacifica]|uniref:MoxR-like ATPase n=1 Tax=Alloyangia pacifica TaxID=311180 RepID=A0A1I6VJS8_9RHOB|nr:MoxR family ATPase [Alloyangia pacifica]SDI01453.1 MoxR-like ATPase [Alloyangia pacifica]SFT13952.1 MoxR-like ATPase [Alloyangia pacifica]
MTTAPQAELMRALAGAGYVADDTLSMALHLAISLGRPLLLEGPAGVGKTEIAKALAEVRRARLIRLQCYEGLDAAHAIYEWNYQRQLLAIRADGASEESLFSDRFLLRRPLLEAITQDDPPVLLIDEIDRADEEFEAYLLEILSDFQITIPEIGTIPARTRPLVVLTANGTRDLSDALRRRCLYTYVDYPDRDTELAILARRGPQIEARLARQIVGVVQALRREELEKKPGIAEMLDWAAALAGLGINDLTEDRAALQATLVCLLKTAADRDAAPPEVLDRIIGKVA